jgi:hypothetical protein
METIKAIALGDREIKLILYKVYYKIEDNKDDSFDNVFITNGIAAMDIYNGKVEEVINGTKVQASIGSEQAL